MRWLALHLPWLSLEAFSATRLPEQQGQPLALVADHRISAVDAAAAERGIRIGLKRATALALAGDLQLAQADPVRDAQALQAVAYVALAFTPMVAMDADHTVVLDVHGSLRYFGGAARLQQRLQDGLAPLGHRVCLAAAPTPLGAALLARWAPCDVGDLTKGQHATDALAFGRLLDAAPVELLGPGREHWEALQGMGLHTLGDLRALPRAGLARRFGAALLDDLDRARGDRADPRTALTLPPRFDSRLELGARADSTAQVLHGAGVLLARLVAWAQAQHARIAAFTLRMAHERARRDDAVPPHTDLHIELAEPSADAAHLHLLLREQLAHCELPAPTLDLRLLCRHAVRRAAPNGELFPTRQSERAGLTRLLERLRARLGDDHVQALQTVADHRPERAHRLAAAVRASPLAKVDVEPGALPLHRPAWLLRTAQPLAERGALPLLDGRPLQIVAGPERIEAGWWDEALAARDYFIARADGGALVWIYRTRLSTPAGWYLQGRFA